MAFILEVCKGASSIGSGLVGALDGLSGKGTGDVQTTPAVEGRCRGVVL
jgi:hypothetical protein